MNIQSILLGSVAALTFVSNAWSADAIVAAEPEPMEYVRVCDAYGTGYFYIPGTETCLKIGGYLRFDVRGGDNLGFDNNSDGKGDTWDSRTRFEMMMSTASDTEYGTLKTFAETRFESKQGVTSTFLKYGYIDIAGFHIGKDFSAFRQWPGFAGKVAIDDAINFGVEDANLISYSFDNNGFSGILSLEDNNAINHDYVPNVVGGLGYANKVFGIKVLGAYDDVFEQGIFKARGDLTLGAFSAFFMGGWATNSDILATSKIKPMYATWQGDWALWTGASYKFNDTFKANSQFAYDDGKRMSVSVNLAYTVVKNFTITPEVVYQENVRVAGENQWGGIVRFQRNF